MRGATFGKPRRFFSMSCFNPRAPCGARRLRSRSASTFCLFQSTRPMRGATTRAPLPLQACHVSIHAPHAGRDDRLSSTRREEKVSIHAPHAGRDNRLEYEICGWGVSIHAPHAGRDTKRALGAIHRGSFNPRAPCGARLTLLPPYLHPRGFNPRAPCGARHDLLSYDFWLYLVSIHAPHAGRDVCLEW